LLITHQLKFFHSADWGIIISKLDLILP